MSFHLFIKYDLNLSNFLLAFVPVWAFDTETECWSLMEAKGDIPVSFSKLVTVKITFCFKH